MVTIRLLKPSDINFVVELTKREKWGYLPKDVKRCLELEPKGCFVAEHDGKRVGHVFSISYGATGWIGLLIVRQSYRGRGIGTALMTAAKNYLRSLSVETIRLEAVPEAVALTNAWVSKVNSLHYDFAEGGNTKKCNLRIRVKTYARLKARNLKI